MKKCIRLLAFLLVTALVATSLPVCSFAASENPYDKYVGNASFTVSTSFCATGETTKIFVDISKDSQMSAAMFVLSYDTSLLKATNVETGLVLKNGYTSKNITSQGLVKVSYADIDPNYEEGRLFEVEFEVIGSVPETEGFIEVPVVLTVEDLRNYEDYRIASTVKNGKITMINTAYGDINLSSDTTATDALMALYSNSQLIELTDEQRVLADVNGDGKVSAADALLILQYSAGEISNYPIFTMDSPAGLNVISKDETYVTLGWSEVKNTVGYNVYMDGEKVNSEPITATEYTVEGLLQDSKHTFAVSTVNVLMESELCEEIEVSTNKADRYVTFKDYDGTILNTQIVLSGEAAVEPAAPVRTGYTFTAWDKDTSVVTVDTEFVAQYEINTYTVTFDYLYNNKTASASAVYNTTVAAPALINRADYTLEGWYRDKNFIQKWNFKSDVVENNITLYANWVTWSAWSTDTSLLNNPLYEVEKKTQYSYSDKSTTTSTATSLSGYTQDGSTTSYGAWTNVGWTKNKPTATDVLQITNTKTVTDQAAYTLYNLYYYRYWNSNASAWYYTYSSSMGGTKYTRSVAPSGLTYNGTYGGYTAYTLNDKSARNFSGELWFHGSTTNVPAVTHTEWYYQTRTKTITYNYYKWSAYSEWSDTVYTASSTRQIKTRTVYRYKLKQQ